MAIAQRKWTYFIAEFKRPPNREVLYLWREGGNVDTQTIREMTTIYDYFDTVASMDWELVSLNFPTPDYAVAVFKMDE